MVHCEKCGKEILIEDKIDNGYVDWCNCDCIKPLKEYRCIHEYFVKNDKYYYRELHLINTLNNIKRLLKQEASVYSNNMPPEKQGYRFGMLKALDIIEEYFGDIENV